MYSLSNFTGNIFFYKHSICVMLNELVPDSKDHVRAFSNTISTMNTSLDIEFAASNNIPGFNSVSEHTI